VVRFWIIQAFIIVTALLLVVTTPGDSGAIRLLDHRVVCTDSSSVADPCWLAFGGVGAISFGIGAGLVSYGWLGAGILFGAGQAATGLIAFGQAVFGPLFFCGQLGLGMSGVGQLAIGGRVVGQGQLGYDGAEYLKDLSERVGKLLAFGSAG
jgi:hypothetical protein